VAQSNSAGLARQLAEFTTQVRWEQLPENVRHTSRRSLLNFIGCALGVANDPAVVTLVDVVTPTAGKPAATLIGRTERLDILNAALVNAVAANLLDYDDTHLCTVIHPTAPIASPILALAESQNSSGQDVLTALVIGAEVACRLGNSVSPEHYARGWHITATCGVFGSAAACAWLLKLSAEQTAHALGLAASQSSGLVENLPTAAKNVGVGNAARNGLFAALLAQKGYKAAPFSLEGPLGWIRATGSQPNPTELVGDLGARWEFAANTFKPYPSGIVMQSVIDACLELRETSGLAPGDIRSIDVAGDALLLARGDRFVDNERDARVSLQHCAAVAYLFGKAGLHEFSPAIAMDPSVATFRAKVHAKLDAALPVGAARVTLHPVSGAPREVTVMHARGSLEKPMTDGEIAAKVRELVAFGRNSGPVHCNVAQVITRVWDLDKADTVELLTRAASSNP
jgi:2-methylcitrate dehydratase PrpD